MQEGEINMGMKSIEAIKLIRELTNRLTGKNRDTMEKIISNYERKDRPEEMLDGMASLCLIFLEELNEEE